MPTRHGPSTWNRHPLLEQGRRSSTEHTGRAPHSVLEHNNQGPFVHARYFTALPRGAMLTSVPEDGTAQEYLRRWGCCFARKSEPADHVTPGVWASQQLREWRLDFVSQMVVLRKHLGFGHRAFLPAPCSGRPRLTLHTSVSPFARPGLIAGHS